MVLKPNFKRFKYKKINFIEAILKLETLPYQNIFTSFHHILYQTFYPKKRGLHTDPKIYLYIQTQKLLGLKISDFFEAS